MTLKNSITTDPLAIFLNTDEFAELIVYGFRAGGVRSLPAIVDRDPPAFYDVVGNVVFPTFSIDIADDCTDGVTAAEIDTGGDWVELIVEHGDTVRTRLTVLKVLESDLDGMIKLALMGN